MSTISTLAFAGSTHAQLRAHLIAPDGKEAAALLFCTVAPGPRLKLLARDVLPIPHQTCTERTRDRISWPGHFLAAAIDRAEADELIVLLVHSHPAGNLVFSELDDASDQMAVGALLQGYGSLHGSAIMTPDGAMRARIYDASMTPRPVDLVTVAGDDILLWWDKGAAEAACRRRPPAFTSAMTEELRRLHAIIIGASGTGSIQAEQAARLGFGKMTLIDFDRIESKNLNRILNSREADAIAGTLKVERLAEAIAEYRGPSVASSIPLSIRSREAVLAASQGDVLFCAVDSLEGRLLADKIAAAFLMPLFDVGVSVPTRRTEGGIAIADAVGRLDYVQPGGATLGDRGVYSPDTLRSEYLRKAAPAAFADELAAGYIKGAIEEAPSVITLNMRAASACMNEFILRAYPFRIDPNRDYARIRFSLAIGTEDHFSEDSFAVRPNALLARGAREPLLGLPALGLPPSGTAV